MANTVPILNFTNTFGDLLSQQNRAAVELNTLGANNYTKDSGTLILNGVGTGLSVTGAAILGSTIVANTASLIGDVTALANVFINGAGFALDVANSANIRKDTVTNNLTSNNVIRSTIVNASGNIFANDISSNNLIRTTTLNAAGNVFVNNLQSNGAIFGASANIVGRIITNSLTSNTSIDGSTLIISNLTTTNDLTTNNTIRTTTLNSSGNVFANEITSNNNTRTVTLNVTGTAFINNLQSNNIVNTATVVASVGIIGNNITSNNTVSAPTINGTTSIIGNNITSNNTVRALNLNSVGTAFVDSLSANNNATIGATLSVLGNQIIASNAAAQFASVSVLGNFTINGNTIYNSPTFVLSASTPNQQTTIATYRTLDTGNAYIRWTETNKYWQMNDVITGNNWRILTDQYRSDITSIGGTTNIATSNAVFYLQGVANTANVQIQGIQGVDLAQNSAITIIQGTDATQNVRLNSIETINTNQNTSITIIQGVDLTQNTWISSNVAYFQGINNTQNTQIQGIQGTDATQNTRLNAIETINTNQNTSITIIQGVDLTQNTWISSNVAYFQGINNTQNSAISIIQGVDVTQNTRLNAIETINSNQNTTITQVNQFAGGAYTTANGAYTTANGANGLAAGAYNTANNRVSSVTGTSGRITSSGGLTPTLDLATAGPGARSNTYSSVTIDAYGRVTALSSGTAPVTSITGTANQIVVTGTTTPTLSLPQNIGTGSNLQFNSLGIGTPGSGTTGEIRATNNITAYFSDNKLKTRLGLIENALDKVMTLNGFYYEANETAQALGYAVKREVGLSAQEVQAVLPEIVVPAPIDEQYLTIHYEKVVPLLVEAIKELQREIQELKNK